MAKMLKEISVPIENLLLDPNNPRFIKDLEIIPSVPDDKLVDDQKKVLDRFETSAKSDKELDVTNIKDLYDSMQNIGFVEIDRIVVKKVAVNDKFLVIEGNRRIATVKKLLNHYENGTIINPTERRKLAILMDSFRKITCMLLETKGLPQEEIKRRINIILGLRHHGSLLKWEPLPKAYNIFNEYMTEEPQNDDFEFNNNKVKYVKNRLSISAADVKSALKTYIAYLQLRDRFSDVKDTHYSLIEYGVTNKYLLGSYFKISGTTYRLDEDSLANMDAVCQFSIRDSIPENKKKIISDPKKFALFGSLIDKRQKAEHEAIKNYANDLIRRVEDEDDIDMTLEQAVDDLTAFENRQQWAKTINKLLDKQEAELKIDDYTGTGNDRGNKDELKSTIEPLRKIMDI